MEGEDTIKRIIRSCQYDSDRYKITTNAKNKELEDPVVITFQTVFLEADWYIMFFRPVDDLALIKLIMFRNGFIIAAGEGKIYEDEFSSDGGSRIEIFDFSILCPDSVLVFVLGF